MDITGERMDDAVDQANKLLEGLLGSLCGGVLALTRTAKRKLDERQQNQASKPEQTEKQEEKNGER